MSKLKFNIGADPEFTLMLQNERVAAKEVFNLYYKPEEISNHGEMFAGGHKIEGVGVIGWDGASSTGELRPKEAKDHNVVCDNIEKLLKEFVSRAQLFELITSSIQAPIGGHIHLEIPVDMAQKIDLSSDGDIENEVMAKKMHDIHKKMSSFYFPLMLSENKINIKLRKSSSYGDINEYRMHQFDTGTTYEFRAPSAEWLTTKRITRATLAYFATIYNEIMFRPEEFEKNNEDILIKTTQQAEVLQIIAETGFNKLGKMFLKDIKKKIKTFKLYEENKEDIEFILSPERVRKEKEKYEFNILKGWNLEPKVPTKRDLLNDKKTKKKASEIDMDRLMPLIKLNYNQDTNVELFVKALKQRVLTHHWKLKNDYFFFGLRKGIDDYFASNKNGEFILGNKKVKTTGDFRAITSIFKKMDQKFQSQSRVSLDNQNKARKNRIISIGIPYDDRINENVKDFISIIHEIENSKGKAGKLLQPQTLDDTGDGLIELAYRGSTNEDGEDQPEPEMIVGQNEETRNAIDEMRNVAQEQLRRAMRNRECTASECDSVGNYTVVESNIEEVITGESNSARATIKCYDCDHLVSIGFNINNE